MSDLSLWSRLKGRNSGGAPFASFAWTRGICGWVLTNLMCLARVLDKSRSRQQTSESQEKTQTPYKARADATMRRDCGLSHSRKAQYSWISVAEDQVQFEGSRHGWFSLVGSRYLHGFQCVCVCAPPGIASSQFQKPRLIWNHARPLGGRTFGNLIRLVNEGLIERPIHPLSSVTPSHGEWGSGSSEHRDVVKPCPLFEHELLEIIIFVPS